VSELIDVLNIIHYRFCYHQSLLIIRLV